MVKIVVDKTDPCTCLMCKETKSIHKMKIEYKGGDGFLMTICNECINKFAKELFDEINNMD